MSLSRRSLILAAGGAGLALSGGYGVYRVTRVPRTASAPWTLDAPAPADVRLDALRHAILAPNPHNRQPWILRLEGEDSVVVACDLDRRLPQTDPFDRQVTIGFGAFIELARMAAAARGVRMTSQAFPDGADGGRLDGRPVARLTFAPDPAARRERLFEAVLERRSNKEAYDTARTPSAQALAALSVWADPAAGVAIAATAEPAPVAAIRTGVLAALALETDLPRTHKESVDLIRIGHQEIDANPDGIDLGGPMMEALKLAGQLDRRQLADPATMAFKSGREQQLGVYGSAPAYIWVTSTDPAEPMAARQAQLDAGRVYLRLNLAATQAGLALHPASQALQEYPEMAAQFARMHALLAPGEGRRVQMLSRIGYGPRVAPSPRWPLSAKLVSS